MGLLYTAVPRPYYDFAGLDLTTRYAFGLIYDRWQLSNRAENRERFTDSRGVYCYYSRSAMAAEMGVTLPTLRTAINVLEARGLIKMSRIERGGSVRYYIPQKTLDMIEHMDDFYL